MMVAGAMTRKATQGEAAQREVTKSLTEEVEEPVTNFRAGVAQWAVTSS